MALDGDHVDLAGRRGDTILDTFVFAGDDRMVRDVWSAGRHVVRDGRHVARDTIAAAYRATLRDLGEAL
jgi:formimidoylglutamate deiminase